jgi:sulfite reductase (NADPH) flavoprotein alpha-component
MARDVERALVDVAAAHGGLETEAAIAFVAGLKRAGRYQADVY